MKDKALKLALEFLEQLKENHWGNRPDVIATIKEALAETDSDAIETLVYMAGLRDGKKMEREACANVAEEGLIGHTIAKAIRARGQALAEKSSDEIETIVYKYSTLYGRRPND